MAGQADWRIQFPFGRVVQRELKTPQIESLRALEVQVLSRPPFTESKPQQTGTGLLIRFGEVATTSGSTIQTRSAEFGTRNYFSASLIAYGAHLFRTPHSEFRVSSASWCNSSMPGFDPDGLGANPSEAANVGRSSFDRSVVK